MYYYKHNSVKQWPKIIEDLTQDLTLTLLMDNSYYVYCTSEFKFNELITLVFKIPILKISSLKELTPAEGPVRVSV